MQSILSKSKDLSASVEMTACMFFKDILEAQAFAKQSQNPLRSKTRLIQL